MEAGNSAVVQPLDPFGGTVDSVAQGNVELGNLPIVDDVAIGGLFKLVFIVLNAVVQALNLFLKAAHFNGCLGFTSGNGGEEPVSDGSEDVWVEFGMGSEGCRNGIGQHRWFWTLNWSDQKRHRVFSR